MTTEILINVAPRENRGALIENGVLTELFVERQSRRGIVSNLYKGRVQRVLPGMQAAFIDVGLERTAFLHAADIAQPDSDSTLMGAPAVVEIRNLVKEGDDILVQVVKDPMGSLAQDRTIQTMTMRAHPLPMEGMLPSFAGATAWLNSPPLTPDALVSARRLSACVSG